MLERRTHLSEIKRWGGMSSPSANTWAMASLAERRRKSRSQKASRTWRKMETARNRLVYHIGTTCNDELKVEPIHFRPRKPDDQQPYAPGAVDVTVKRALAADVARI
jgi:hypothetical protein